MNVQFEGVKYPEPVYQSYAYII